MEHGYTTGDEYDDADSRGGCYGSGWPSADVPLWNSHAPIKKQTNKHMSETYDDGDLYDLYDSHDDGPYYNKTQTPKGFWKQKDGTYIEIKKMTDSHIKNSISLCERKDCSFLADDLVCEQQRREKILDIYRMKHDIVYAAFCAGWNAGHKSAYHEAYPDVGMDIFTITKETAWAQYKKSKTS